MSENTMLVPQMGITAEQATANCEELAKAIREITAGVLTTVNSFCRWIQQVAAEVAAQQEMETALRWASVDNRPLYNRYRLSVEGLRERGMVEEVTTAMERRRQEHGRA